MRFTPGLHPAVLALLLGGLIQTGAHAAPSRCATAMPYQATQWQVLQQPMKNYSSGKTITRAYQFSADAPSFVSPLGESNYASFQFHRPEDGHTNGLSNSKPVFSELIRPEGYPPYVSREVPPFAYPGNTQKPWIKVNLKANSYGLGYEKGFRTQLNTFPVDKGLHYLMELEFMLDNGPGHAWELPLLPRSGAPLFWQLIAKTHTNPKDPQTAKRVLPDGSLCLQGGNPVLALIMDEYEKNTQGQQAIRSVIVQRKYPNVGDKDVSKDMICWDPSKAGAMDTSMPVKRVGLKAGVPIRVRINLFADDNPKGEGCLDVRMQYEGDGDQWTTLVEDFRGPTMLPDIAGKHWVSFGLYNPGSTPKRTSTLGTVEEADRIVWWKNMVIKVKKP
ncbi:hypothetical protein [Chitinimonas lacunae]|uniref:Uncharacterized protein n=1 Tax=Chitinimonas lacunae TaxID=1963018 RepID=A0ABV8MVP7_9NEIS